MHPGAIALLSGQGRAITPPASPSQHRESWRKHPPFCAAPLHPTLPYQAPKSDTEVSQGDIVPTPVPSPQ